MRIRAMKKQSQNKPNFKIDKMNLNFYLTKDYENKHNWTLGENKPNQSQFQTRSEAEIPTGELLGILKPGTNLKTLPQRPALPVLSLSKGATPKGSRKNKKVAG